MSRARGGSQFNLLLAGGRHRAIISERIGQTGMEQQRMNLPSRLRSAAVPLMVGLALAAPTHAADPDLDRFRTEIDAFVGRVGASTNGVVKWAGSDPYLLRHEGDALVAVIANARLSFRTEKIDHLTLDRVEIREIGQKDGGKLVELVVLLPNELTLEETDGSETKITLKDAKANALVEAQSARGRETTITIGSARFDQPKTGAWASFGPLSMTSKLVADPTGGWSAPVEFELKDLTYFIPQGPVGGEIGRIVFSGKSAGPKLGDLDRLREAIDTLHSDDTRSPQARSAAFLAVLTTIAAPFATIGGEFALEGLGIRGVTGEALVSLAKAASSIEVSGLDGEVARMRLSVRHQGLDLAPSILEASKVPHRVVLDLGLSNLNTAALTKLLQASALMADASGTDESENQPKKQQAIQQALGAAAMLNPTFHIYDVAFDAQDVGVDLTAEVKGSPLAPKGYSAAGDIVVRGFDAIPNLNSGALLSEYLPVLRELGIEDTAADGSQRLDFHLASAPGKWITVNGNDVSVWRNEAPANQAEPRLLKPSDPPMRGNDVKSVQQALAAAQITVAQDGIYSGPIAAAVARFQKQKGLNVSGVVDAETRQLLGISEDGRNR